jgi:hypothetical protein
MTPDEPNTFPRLPVDVEIPQGFKDPLPLLVMEHPERSRKARVTAVRALLVELAAQQSRVQESFRRCEATGPTPMPTVMLFYRRAADAAAEALWLPHRRDLLLADGPLPLRHDTDLLARLPPRLLRELSVATAFLHVTLTWNRGLAIKSLELAVREVPALIGTERWLAASLLRFLHLRWYEVLWGTPAPDGSISRIPFAIEEAAVVHARGPVRRLNDRAPRESGYPLAYAVLAWWARRVDGKGEDAVWQWWHAHYRSKAHRVALETASDADGRVPRDCGCRRMLPRALAEVQRLVADPS